MNSPRPAPTVAARIKQIRVDVFGEAGIHAVASELGIPSPTWANYEAGVVMPGHILLSFIAITGVSPFWLLDGRGDPLLRNLEQSSSQVNGVRG